MEFQQLKIQNTALEQVLKQMPAHQQATIKGYIQELKERLSELEEQKQEIVDVCQAGDIQNEQSKEYDSWFSLREGVCIYNFTRRKLVNANQAFSEMFRFAEGQLIYDQFYTLFPQAQSDGRITITELKSAVKGVLKTKKSEHLYLELQKTDGLVFPAEVTLVPDFTEEDSIIIIFRDQTLQRKAKEELVKSEELYRDFIECAPVGTIKIGLSGLVEFSSISAEEIFGYNRHEYINQPIIDRIHEEDQVYFLSLIKGYAEKENRILDGEFRAIRKDGSMIWVKGYGQVKLDDNNRPAYLLASFYDISESKETESLLSEREAIYQALVANSREGIDILDVTDYHPIRNPKAKLLIRNKRMAFILRDEKKLFASPEDFKKIGSATQTKGRTVEEVFYESAKRLFRKGFSREILRLEYPDGLKMDIEGQEQILDVTGKKILIRIYQDITQRIRQEEQIEEQLLQMNEQNADLQTYIQSNMQLENFAYIASHDLRAPIRNIVSFSNLLERRAANKLDESEQEFLKYIVDSASNMSDLIEDLLTFSRANTQKRKLSEFNFSNIVKQIDDELGTLVSSKGARLIWPEKELQITADHIKLYQILLNLIGNGLKFTADDTPPVIKVNFQSSKKFWTFSVADNGIGIPTEFAQQIFLIFKRLHSQMDYDGTGIGLAICKKLVDQHNGQIWVESVEGGGSTFHFTIAKDLS